MAHITCKILMSNKVTKRDLHFVNGGLNLDAIVYAHEASEEKKIGNEKYLPTTLGLSNGKEITVDLPLIEILNLLKANT